MIKKNFEVWRFSSNTLCVMVRSARLFKSLQNQFKRFPQDYKYRKNDEPVFRVPEASAKRLWTILGVKHPPESL